MRSCGTRSEYVFAEIMSRIHWCLNEFPTMILSIEEYEKSKKDREEQKKLALAMITHRRLGKWSEGGGISPDIVQYIWEKL